MNKNILLFLFCVLILHLNAQESTKKRFHIGLSAGAAVPFGDYESTAVNNEGAGFARIGLCEAINVGYRFADKFGIALQLNAFKNPVDEEGMKNVFRRMDPSLYWNLQSDPWVVNSFSGGFMYSEIFEKIDLDLRVLIGSCYVSSPALDVFAANNENSVRITQHEASNNTMGILLGFSSRFHLGPYISLSLNLDYLSLTPEFKVLFVYDEEASLYSFSQKIDVLNLSAGLAVRF